MNKVLEHNYVKGLSWMPNILIYICLLIFFIFIFIFIYH